MNDLALITYVVQAAAGMVTAFLLLRFWWMYRREYLRRWGWSWAALAGHQVAAALGYQVSTVTTDPANTLRVPLSMLAVTFAAWQAILLLSGTWLSRSESPGSDRSTRWWLGGSAVVSIAAVALTSDAASPELRRMVRIGLPLMLMASGYLVMAVMLLARARPLRGIATPMLAMTALAHAIGLGLSLWTFVQAMIAPPAPFAITEYVPLLIFLLQTLLGMGMVVWLVEVERTRALSASAALGESESRLARLFENVRLVVWEFNRSEQRFTYVSPQAEEILGYTVAEWATPQFWFEHVHPEDRDRASAFSHEQTQRGVDHEFEYRMLHEDGRVLWIRDLTSIVKTGESIDKLRGVLIDVTHQHLTEEAMRQSEQRLRGLFQSAVDPLWDWDVKSDQSAFSPSWKRLLEWPNDPAAGEPPEWEDLLHPDDKPRALAMLAASLKHSDVPYEAEYRLRTFTGGWKWVMSRGRVVERDATGRAMRMVGNITDISGRMRSEQSLRESEARLRAVIDNAPNVAIQGYDLSGRVLFWNAAAEAIFGWSEREAVGRTLDQLMLDVEDARMFVETLHELNRGGSPATLSDTAFVHRNGTQGWCYSAVFRIPGGPTPTFICMDVDITHRKKTEQALERSSSLQRLLLSELDHRVRNNLASLMALIDISSRDSGSVRDFAGSIRSRVRAMSVVHALLSREHWRSVDLRQLLLTLAPVGAPGALQIEGPPINIVPRQATALGMVLQELLANSQKYGALATPETGRVDVQWLIEEPRGDSREMILRLGWRERGGQPIVQPVREGVGTELIKGLVKAEMGGEATLRFPIDGAIHDFTLVLDAAHSETAELGTQAEATIGL